MTWRPSWSRSCWSARASRRRTGAVPRRRCGLAFGRLRARRVATETPTLSARAGLSAARQRPRFRAVAARPCRAAEATFRRSSRIRRRTIRAHAGPSSRLSALAAGPAIQDSLRWLAFSFRHSGPCERACAAFGLGWARLQASGLLAEAAQAFRELARRSPRVSVPGSAAAAAARCATRWACGRSRARRHPTRPNATVARGACRAGPGPAAVSDQGL